MSKGGGGGYDTSGMEQATAEATALQERMYEEGVARSQPFYDVGVGGLNMLSDYLGIDRAPQQRQSIYDQLLPQYTTAGTPATGMGTYLPTGELVAPMTAEDFNAQYSAAEGNAPLQQSLNKKWQDQWADPNDRSQGLSEQYTTGGTPDSIDYTGLNAAVDAQMGSQEQPDYYGSLLQKFGDTPLELDPSYQFRLGEGQKAIERSMSASGKTFSPEAIKALEGYGQDFASQEYGRAYDRYNIDQTNIYNRLMGITGMGQQQAAQTTALGSQYASDVGQSLGSLAQAQAAAQQAKASDRSSMFGNILGLGGAVLGGPLGGAIGSGIGGLFGGGSGYTQYTPQMLFS